MYYGLVTEMVELIKIYEEESGGSRQGVHEFGQWLHQYLLSRGNTVTDEPDWEGKEKGRTADSVINTSLVHLYRYAKLQAKAAIQNTSFSTPDEFIYLIGLASFGSMTKSALIRLNVHEKSAGMQIVKRLLDNELVEQTAVDTDKRNRMLHITQKGSKLLKDSMENIRQATRNVTEPLTNQEKMDLIRLLSKLEKFHEQRVRGEI